jgi:hypothetical protein
LAAAKAAVADHCQLAVLALCLAVENPAAHSAALLTSLPEQCQLLAADIAALPSIALYSFVQCSLILRLLLWSAPLTYLLLLPLLPADC